FQLVRRHACALQRDLHRLFSPLPRRAAQLPAHHHARILKWPHEWSPRDAATGTTSMNLRLIFGWLLGIFGLLSALAAKEDLIADSTAWKVATPFPPAGLKFESKPALK